MKQNHMEQRNLEKMDLEAIRHTVVSIEALSVRHVSEWHPLIEHDHHQRDPFQNRLTVGVENKLFSSKRTHLIVTPTIELRNA